MARHERTVTDGLPVRDDANALCTSCGRPQLFCDCPEEEKRTADGWTDQNP